VCARARVCLYLYVYLYYIVYSYVCMCINICMCARVCVCVGGGRESERQTHLIDPSKQDVEVRVHIHHIQKIPRKIIQYSNIT